LYEKKKIFELGNADILAGEDELELVVLHVPDAG
jgi:hypothetical protein